MYPPDSRTFEQGTRNLHKAGYSEDPEHKPEPLHEREGLPGKDQAMARNQEHGFYIHIPG